MTYSFLVRKTLWIIKGDRSTCFLPSLRLKRFASLVSPIVCCFQGVPERMQAFPVSKNLPLKGAGHITKTRALPNFKANFYQLQHFTQSLSNLLAIGTAWFRTDATAQYIMGDSDRNVVYFGVEFFLLAKPASFLQMASLDMIFALDY